MNWNKVWDGSIWVGEQSEQPNGKLFERVSRAPGSRIIIVKDGKILFTREKRGELDGKLDYRLPGGKVFDTNAEYQAFLATGKDIKEASRASITNEALEEAGIIIDPSNLMHLGVDVLGATVSWDLHYWLATTFELHADGAQFHDSEADEIEGNVWLTFQDAWELITEKDRFADSRSAAMVLRYLDSRMDKAPNPYCIPFVAAIVERTTDSGLELLIQTRDHASHASIYNGTLEFPAGSMDERYENVYDTIVREVKEEAGLTVKAFINDSQTEPVSPQKIDKAFGFRPYCCTQQLKEGRPWVGFIFRCEVEDGEPVSQIGEAKDGGWMPVADFYKIYRDTPEKIFTLELPAWDYYFKEFPA